MSDEQNSERNTWDNVGVAGEGAALENSGEDVPLVLKLIMLGDSAVGKSCILFRYIYNVFKQVTELTIGVNFIIKPVQLEDGQKVLVNLCDTAGQEKFYSLTKLYVRGAQIAIVVYDITSRTSFIKANDWINDLYSLLGKENVSIVLVGNKSDLSSRRQISTETAKRYADEHGFAFMEVSAKAGKNINELFYEAVKTAKKEHPIWFVPRDTPKENGTINIINDSDLGDDIDEPSPLKHKKCC